MQPRANRYAHPLLGSLLVSCGLFSPVLVADAPATQYSALSVALSETRLASWRNLLDNWSG
jgi:hypothetical protein